MKKLSINLFVNLHKYDIILNLIFHNIYCKNMLQINSKHIYSTYSM